MKSLKKITPVFLVATITLFSTLFSGDAFSMGAKRPAPASVVTEVKPIVQQVVTSAITQTLPLFWNINTGPLTSGLGNSLGRTLPLIENLLPLFGSVSPLLSTVLPVISTVAKIGTQLQQSQLQRQQQVDTFGGPYLDQIKTLAENSSCAEFVWKNGTKAPVGLIKGMALSFARSSCRLKKSETTPSTLVNILINAVTKKNPLDALLSYKNILSNLGLSLNSSGADPLRAVYLLNLGTTMAENGGEYCNKNDKNNESLSSKLTSTVLSKLLSEYKGGNALRCFADIFQEGTNCRGTNSTNTMTNYNSSCPAYGVEVASMLLRLQGVDSKVSASKSAEIVPQCDELFKNVQELIDQDPENACADIF